jgi:hypothetical protein
MQLLASVQSSQTSVTQQSGYKFSFRIQRGKVSRKINWVTMITVKISGSNHHNTNKLVTQVELIVGVSFSTVPSTRSADNSAGSEASSINLRQSAVVNQIDNVLTKGGSSTLTGKNAS